MNNDYADMMGCSRVMITHMTEEQLSIKELSIVNNKSTVKAVQPD
jgi:hypothetical protein